MSGINRKDLEAKGFDLTDDGASVEARRRDPADAPSCPSGIKRTKEPMPQAIIDAIVEAIPPPEKPWDVKVPTVFGIDPSVVEAGIAYVGFQLGPAIQAINPDPTTGLGDRLAHLAHGVSQFIRVGQMMSLHVCRPGRTFHAIIEGHYWQSSGDASATSIQTYCEAVGTCFGTARAICNGTVLRVETSWAPEILMGRVRGGTTKADRHAVAKGLLARVGIEWPEGITEHEQDALCFCVAHLVEGGWL